MDNSPTDLVTGFMGGEHERNQSPSWNVYGVANASNTFTLAPGCVWGGALRSKAVIVIVKARERAGVLITVQTSALVGLQAEGV